MACLSTALVALTAFSVCFAVPSVLQVNPGGNSLLKPIQEIPPKPYEFGFQFGDGLGMNQHRREVSDGSGSVTGSYGYLDALGLNRVVDYTANNDGYKAVIRSNEPGVASQNAANAIFIVQPPPPAAVAQGLRRVIPKIYV